jgi:hypothetical protein
MWLCYNPLQHSWSVWSSFQLSIIASTNQFREPLKKPLTALLNFVEMLVLNRIRSYARNTTLRNDESSVYYETTYDKAVMVLDHCDTNVMYALKHRFMHASLYYSFIFST